MDPNRMQTRTRQLELNMPTLEPADEQEESVKPRKNGRVNQLAPEDRAFHDWYRFVLSFPPHLVRSYLDGFGLDSRSTILDPFCGTGTTLVEAKLRGVRSIGLEANPIAHFASSVKLDWGIDPDLLTTQAQGIARVALGTLRAQGIEDSQLLETDHRGTRFRTLDPEAQGLILAHSISPLPLHKTLILLDCLNAHRDEPYYRHAVLALANAIVYRISNLHFGPEVGVRDQKTDAAVVAIWLSEVDKIAHDLHLVAGKSHADSTVHLADARQIGDIVKPNSIDAVITSPLYPNEKDYTRTTRLESVILGFIRNKEELRALKRQLLRSNTRGVYKGDDDDDWVSNYPEIQRIAEAIEKRRIEMGKDSGFERMYSRVTRLYFGGMAHHFSELREALRPGAQLAYVVGDQASYLRVMIRTGQLLADIARTLGYELIKIDLFRTRLATATREQLREEVVVLRWGG